MKNKFCAFLLMLSSAMNAASAANTGTTVSQPSFTILAAPAVGATKSATLKDWLSIVEQNNHPTYVLSGHSLGGAGALQLGATLIDNNIPGDRIKLITYGQPAVGYWGFVNKYQPLLEKYFRFANIGNPDLPASRIGDPVVSSTTVLFAYQHFGKQFLIADDVNVSLPFVVPDEYIYLAYNLTLHNSYNYTDFVAGCNVLDSRCPAILRK